MSWRCGVTVSDRRLDGAGLAALGRVLGDPDVLARYAAKVVTVPGSDCGWWTGAVSGRGHGRFWFPPRRVIIAHRFAFAMVHGVEALRDGGGARTQGVTTRCASASERVTLWSPRRWRTAASWRAGGGCSDR